jgi:3-deoxy-D-manno-octulosonic-acid transferase
LIFLYNIFLRIYLAALHVASLWNPKAKLWVSGRKDWKKKLKDWQKEISADKLINSPLTTNNSQLTPHPSPLIWMHCASLGEFEQGRPLLEALKEAYPQHKIVLSFFSPSGYEIRKNYTGADLVVYLPMDGAANAEAFISAINPSLVLWVKYEYWHYYLAGLKKRNIPVLLVSGIFRESQPFFQWYGHFWKKILRSFEHLFVQTSASAEILNPIGFHDNITVTGDTRFDRVTAIADQWTDLGAAVEQFCNGHQVLVAGSTWEEDEELLIHYARTYPEIRFIIAAHDVTKERIADLLK